MVIGFANSVFILLSAASASHAQSVLLFEKPAGQWQYKESLTGRMDRSEEFNSLAGDRSIRVLHFNKADQMNYNTFTEALIEGTRSGRCLAISEAPIKDLGLKADGLERARHRIIYSCEDEKRAGIIDILDGDSEKLYRVQYEFKKPQLSPENLAEAKAFLASEVAVCASANATNCRAELIGRRQASPTNARPSLANHPRWYFLVQRKLEANEVWTAPELSACRQAEDALLKSVQHVVFDEVESAQRKCKLETDNGLLHYACLPKQVGGAYVGYYFGTAEADCQNQRQRFLPAQRVAENAKNKP